MNKLDFFTLFNKNNIKYFIYFYLLNLLILIFFTNNFFLNFDIYVNYGDYYINGYQGLCLNPWKSKLIETIFYSHSQAPLIPFIIGVLLKLNLYPNGFFILNTIAATFILILELKLIKLFIKERVVYLLFFAILLLNPSHIWLQFILGWEIYFQLFILSFTLASYKVYKNKDESVNYIILSISFVLLVLLRSTFSIHIFLLLSVPIFLISNRVLFLKKFFIPTLLIILALLFKNFFIHNSFSSQTQGILHLGFSHSPIVIENNEVYESWSNETKMIYKNGLPPLWRNPGGHEKLGFVAEETGIEILDDPFCQAPWSSKNMALVSNSFGPIIKSQIFNEYDYLKNINFFRNTYNNFWGNVIEIQNLWDEGIKLNEVYYKIKNFEALIPIHSSINVISSITFEKILGKDKIELEYVKIDIKSLFITLLAFSYLILLIMLIRRRNFKEVMLLSMILSLISYTVFAAVVSKPANFRFRMVIENFYLIFMFFIFYKFIFTGNRLFNNSFILIKKYYLFFFYSLFFIGCILLNQLITSKISNHNDLHYSSYKEDLNFEFVEIENNKVKGPIVNNIQTFFTKQLDETSFENLVTEDDFFEIKRPKNGTSFEPKSMNYILIRGSNKIKVDIQDFHIQKNEVSLNDYFLFLDETKHRYPIWYDSSKSINENLENYKSRFIYDHENKIPISGISYSDAFIYSKWLSYKTGYNLSIPSNFHWEYAFDNIFIKNNDYNIAKELTNSLINRQPFNNNLIENKIDVRDDTLYGNSFNFIGGMWEFAMPEFKYLFTMEKYTYDYVDLQTFNNLKEEIYLYPTNNKIILKGGSYLTSWMTNNAAYRMFIGKEIMDEDFGIRLICNNCNFK